MANRRIAWRVSSAFWAADTAFVVLGRLVIRLRRRIWSFKMRFIINRELTARGLLGTYYWVDKWIQVCQRSQWKDSSHKKPGNIGVPQNVDIVELQISWSQFVKGRVHLKWKLTFWIVCFKSTIARLPFWSGWQPDQRLFRILDVGWIWFRKIWEYWKGQKRWLLERCRPRLFAKDAEMNWHCYGTQWDAIQHDSVPKPTLQLCT